MKERITRILELVAEGRLGHDDAARLLEALSPKLTLSEEARPHLFGLLSAPDFGVDRVADLLLLRVGVPGFPGAGMGPRGPLRGLDDLGRQISSTIENAFDGAFGHGGLNRGAPRPGRTLRISVEDENGGEFNANLPLSLAEHAAKLIPPRAMEVLEKQGITAEALTLMLGANPPVGKLLSIEDENGTEINLAIE